MSVIQEEKEISIREAREVVKDLMVPNAFIYWVDFLFHIVLGWCSFYLCYNAVFFLRTSGFSFLFQFSPFIEQLFLFTK